MLVKIRLNHRGVGSSPLVLKGQCFDILENKKYRQEEPAAECKQKARTSGLVFDVDFEILPQSRFHTYPNIILFLQDFVPFATNNISGKYMGAFAFYLFAFFPIAILRLIL